MPAFSRCWVKATFCCGEWAYPCSGFSCYRILGLLSSCAGERMETHSSTLAWKIPWMEQPGRLQSMGSRRVGHDWATSFSLFTFMHWRRKGQPTPVFLPGESQGHRVWWAAVYAVAQSWTRLKRLSSSSSSSSCAAAQGMWNLPGAGIMSLALAGGFLTTRPPGKTDFFFFYDSNLSCM